MEQKIKQVGIDIGGNIRRIRLQKGYGQTELVRMLQLENIDMTRESLVKIERGIQHITGTQLRGIRDCLQTTYDDLLSESFNKSKSLPLSVDYSTDNSRLSFLLSFYQTACRLASVINIRLIFSCMVSFASSLK